MSFGVGRDQAAKSAHLLSRISLWSLSPLIFGSIVLELRFAMNFVFAVVSLLSLLLVPALACDQDGVLLDVCTDSNCFNCEPTITLFDGVCNDGKRIDLDSLLTGTLSLYNLAVSCVGVRSGSVPLRNAQCEVYNPSFGSTVYYRASWAFYSGPTCGASQLSVASIAAGLLFWIAHLIN